MPLFEDYHRTIVGYHGTTRANAEAIVRHERQFKFSRNDDDWLGHGIYFWEYAPQRAWSWARGRYSPKTEVAVLGSMIRLGNCLDLLEPERAIQIRAFYRQLERDTKLAGRSLPKNYNAKKRLDCAVFEYTCSVLEEGGEPLDSIRGVYVPTSRKKRLWERSWLYEEAHIQLCVRNPRCILGTWLLKPSAT